MLGRIDEQSPKSVELFALRPAFGIGDQQSGDRLKLNPSIAKSVKPNPNCQEEVSPFFGACGVISQPLANWSHSPRAQDLDVDARFWQEKEAPARQPPKRRSAWSVDNQKSLITLCCGAALTSSPW